jgi:hypothetical protein
VEIQTSSIGAVLIRIDTENDVCDIWFADTLTAPEETTLDAIVAAHSGEPLTIGGLDTTNHIFNELGGFVYTGDMVPLTRE